MNYKWVLLNHIRRSLVLHYLSGCVGLVHETKDCLGRTARILYFVGLCDFFFDFRARVGLWQYLEPTACDRYKISLIPASPVPQPDVSSNKPCVQMNKL